LQKNTQILVRET